MRRFLPSLLCFLALGLALTACGSSDTESAGPSKAEIAKELAGAPAPLRAVHAQANEFLDGGPAAFEKRLRELRGHPVVVNKWGSWCDPCRRELPYFQAQAIEHGKRVAFLGVDAADYSRAPAEDLLKKIPLTYPSYVDDDLKISALFNGVVATPVTAFYDSRGELAYLKQGEYRGEQDLARDIRRHAR